MLYQPLVSSIWKMTQFFTIPDLETFVEVRVLVICPGVNQLFDTTLENTEVPSRGVLKGAGGTLLDYFLVDLDPSFALDTEEHLLYPLRSMQLTEPPLRQYCRAFPSFLSPCFCPPRRGLRPVKTWCSRRACASKHSQTRLRYGSLRSPSSGCEERPSFPFWRRYPVPAVAFLHHCHPEVTPLICCNFSDSVGSGPLLVKSSGSPVHSPYTLLRVSISLQRELPTRA